MYNTTEYKTVNPQKVSFMYLRNGASMLVQFDSYKERVACGRVQTLYYKRPFEFRSLDKLLLIIDDVLDSVDFEKDPADLRRLYGEDEAGHLVFQRFNMEDVYTEEDIINRKYENPFKGELVIRVLGRQNGSMQGEVRIGTGTARFRSSLELLRMLYEFLDHRYSK